MIFVVVKQFARRLDEWSVAQANCKLYKKQQKDSIFLWRVCLPLIWFDKLPILYGEFDPGSE